MSTPREIRKLAFLALYQMDAHAEPDEAAVRDALDRTAEDLSSSISEREIERAMRTASEAFAHRRAYDALVRDLAPSWPSHRQPAIDRALLRLAIHEMSTGSAPPKVAIAEAVRLAKAYSTDRSPAFVNGVLDRLYKSGVGETTSASGEGADA